MSPVRYIPVRPTWCADSLDDALVRLGYTAEAAESIIAQASMDPLHGGGNWSLVLDRHDMADLVDVLIPSLDQRGTFVVVAEGHVGLSAETRDEAFDNWPYGGAVYVTAWQRSVGARA